MSRIANRAQGMALLLAFLAASPHPLSGQPNAVAQPHVVVYKSPTCGCCGKWIEHMQANGFKATATDMPDVNAVKDRNHVPPELRSCHTSFVGGYVIEGHVPAEDIKRLLRERPAIVGLAAPGMPAGSPGMDVPGSPRYEVLAFDRNGRTRVFATHPAR